MQKHFYGFELTRLIDGDTMKGVIDLGFKVKLSATVRFASINCPESRTLDKREKELSKVATQFVADLFQDADIELMSHNFGKYGRVIATPYATKRENFDGQDATRVNVCDALVEAGLARWYDGGKRKPWFS